MNIIEYNEGSWSQTPAMESYLQKDISSVGLIKFNTNKEKNLSLSSPQQTVCFYSNGMHTFKQKTAKFLFLISIFVLLSSKSIRYN